MELPPLDPRNNVLSLEFATVQQNALLLYNYESREDSESEFLALEIVDGKAQLSYNLGNGTVRINTEQDIADGYFHTITASRTGQVSPNSLPCSDTYSTSRAHFLKVLKPL